MPSRVRSRVPRSLMDGPRLKSYARAGLPQGQFSPAGPGIIMERAEMLTTTIGAYPKPYTVPVLDWFSAEAEADPIAPTRSYTTTLAEGGSALAEILDRATEEVVREQDEFG